ncbi:MAG: iron(III) transport system permease protein [Gammaproteobacteria bacterium]|jgi:iron(III) transport system permease protein
MNKVSVIPSTGFVPGLYHRDIFHPWLQGLILISGLLAIPVICIFLSIFLDSGDVWTHLYETVLGSYIVNSLALVSGVGFLVLILGTIPAWLITMYRFPGSKVLGWALLLPMAIPAYIIAYTYTGLLDVAGPLQMMLRETFAWQYGDYWFPDVRSLGGAIVMLSLVLYPYVYLLSRAAFIEQSICVLEVSRSLGCGPYRSFFKVGLPLARPAIIAGLSLVMMETLADYGTVQYFGVATFTTGIFRTWFGLGSSVAAAQLAAVLLMFIMLVVLLEAWSRRQARYHHTSNRYSKLVQSPLQGWPRLLAMMACILPVAFGFLIPAVQLSLWASQTWTEVVDRRFFALIGHSIELAAIASIVALVLALFIAYGKRLLSNALTRFVVRLLGLGYAIPGTVVAVGVLIPFAWLDNSIDTWMRENMDMSTGLLLSGTLFSLIFAYLVRFLPMSLNTVEAGLSKIRPAMDEVGRSMGLKAGAILTKVHVPMLKGSILTAALLVFVDVLKELPATLILRPFNFNTLAIRTYELANEERLADAANPALAIVLVGIIPVIILSRSISRSRPGHD